MANKYYFKLGEKASVFYDPSLRILIAEGEVLEFDKLPKSKKFNMARSGGHIVSSSEEEYNEYLEKVSTGNLVKDKTTAEEVPATEKPEVKGKLTPEEVALKKDLEGMDDNQAIYDHFKSEGFLEEDLEKLEEKLDSKKSNFIKLALDLNKTYK